VLERGIMQIKLSFLGAARNVTGSRFMVEVNGLKVLVDCGLYQERELKKRNWDPFPVPPAEIDAVLLTHAHLDHCGLLPKLVREGFEGKIYCTAATAQIARIILLDAGHLQEEDAAYKLKRHRKEGRTGPFPVVPLYTAEDARRCLPFFSPVRYCQPVTLGRNVKALFQDAGHVFGSSIITLHAKRDGQPSRTILFSGDVGRRHMPILQDPAILDHADYLLVESTYGDRIHQPSQDVQNQLAEIINSTYKAGGNLVIPSFALERSQDILYHLNELRLAEKIPDIDVFLDSPMAIEITRVFEKHPELFDEEMSKRISEQMSPFKFPRLHMTVSTRESKEINNISRPIIVIAGSGMCTGGRIKHHLVSNITRKESTILFIGYQAAGTLGRSIVSGAKEVRILGQKRPVKARIVQMSGFSAHADRDELYHWLSGLNKPPREVFVVHGEADSANAFADFLRDKTNWKVTVPAYEDEIVLS